MKKEKFENDILGVLKEHGYKTEGIREIRMLLSVNAIPELTIEYFTI